MTFHYELHTVRMPFPLLCHTLFIYLAVDVFLFHKGVLLLSSKKNVMGWNNEDKRYV